MSAFTARFRALRWPGSVVVFDRHFGDTHAMSETVAAVLRELVDNPDATTEGVAAALMRSGVLSDPDEAVRAVQDAERLLAEHGLPGRSHGEGESALA